MKRTIAIVTVTFAALGITGYASYADPSASLSSSQSAPPQCSVSDLVTSCPDSGRSGLTVSGEQSSTPTSSSATNGDHRGPGVERAGAVRSVPCGSAADLPGIGHVDTTTSIYATACYQWQADCAALTRHDGRTEAAVVRFIKNTNGTWSPYDSACQPVGNAPPHVTPEMVRQEAQRLVPRAAIGLAPKQKTLVNVETIMWVDTPRERDLPVATILGQQVTIHITVTGVAWDYGDDNTVAHGPIGTPYDAKHNPCKTKQCADYEGHTYTTTGHMAITATVSWRASFRVGGGPVTAIPGALTGPTAAADVLVREARAVLVPDDPH
jgi:hypothetical protein